MKIRGNSKLDDLSYLRIRAIYGDVIIEQNNSLTKLDNLKRISFIGKNFIVNANSHLSEIQENHSIRFIGGDFTVSNNNNLSVLGDLSNLQLIGGNYSIINNGNIGNIVNHANEMVLNTPDLMTFGKLKSIGGEFNVINNSLLSYIPSMNSLKSIGGSFKLINNPKMEFVRMDSLKHINGDMIIKRMNKMVYNPFICVDTVLGNIEVVDNENIIAAGNFLNCLEYTKGNIDILNNKRIGYINNLGISIDGYLNIQNNPKWYSVNKPYKLKRIAGYLNISNNESINTLVGFSSIDPTSIKSKVDTIPDLSICNNSNLSNCEIFHICDLLQDSDITIKIKDNANGCKDNVQIDSICNADTCFLNGYVFKTQKEIDAFPYYHPGCKVYGGNLEIDGVLVNDLRPFINLEKIEGILRIGRIGHSLDSLINLEGLNNIEVVNGSIGLNGGPVGSCKGMDNLTQASYLGIESDVREINGFNKLTKLKTLNIQGDNIEYITGFENLRRLKYLKILHCNSLKNIDGFSLLRSVNNIVFYYNKSLLSINGIQNIIAQDIEYFNISNNSSLSNCSIKSVCEILSLDESKIKIRSNNDGCLSKEDLNCNRNSLSGICFHDVNNNKVKDSLEFGIQGIKVNVDPSDYTKLTNKEGRYLQVCDSGKVYKISIVTNPDWILTTDSSVYTVQFEPGDSTNSLKDFGLIPTNLKHDLNIYLSSAITRCNTKTSFYLNLKDNGAFIESGEVRLKYDPSVQFDFACPEPENVDSINKIITWTFSDLYPYLNKEFEIRFKMPDENSTGDPISFIAEVYNYSNDTLVLNDKFLYTPVVRCSFDPNDKQVSPIGVQEQHYTLKDDVLTYTIRFQNTGNAEAIDILILDTLDAKLDINTFKVVSNSHTVQTEIFKNIVKFSFKNINLPDSASNLIGSQGFVVYEVKLKTDSHDYSIIENTANILFDYNPAIKTNTTTNTMVEKIPLKIDENNNDEILFLRPNPTNKRVTIVMGNNIPIKRVNLYNVMGEHVKTAYDKVIDVTQINKGIYLLIIEFGNKRVVKKLIVY